MDFRSDVVLRGMAWDQTIRNLGNIFTKKNATNYSIFLLSMSIGIMYDKQVKKLEEAEDGDTYTVPRNVLTTHNMDGRMDFMYQAAILTSQTVDFGEDERLEMAFGDDYDSSKKIEFLTGFANFGATKLAEKVGSSDLESMENIKNFLVSTLEGRNFDIDALMDEDLLDDWTPDFDN